ncbi:macro domain-containing protein [Sulfurimonas sp. HSL-1716]|uniref:type II toxin-antitoxin system antitoxin DNA ADP-ribosyl glycohydrolase DarG n=1 Tax=Hydrocurvibacter sulfurireducens TaxID=3131937 RepID=UPI0031F84FAA
MYTLTTGNILESEAECLVNTVNCEGFMGKGLAYQFKNKFPLTNESYMKACKSHELHPGKLHYFFENEKLIINFPTKDKWREKSKIEYIENGMKALVDLLKEKNIQSIAIPPLGSGNGGLNWKEVKKVIESYIFPLSKEKDIYVYEPALMYKADVKKAPKLTMSHMILMTIKKELDKFSKIRLQKAAFFINVLSRKDYFKFQAHHYGPYSYAIDILSRDIKEFQEFHKFQTEKALAVAHQTLTSEKMEKELSMFLPFIKKAAKLVNSYSSNEKLELIATVCFIILNNQNINEVEVIKKLHEWSEKKKNKFSQTDISNAINELLNLNIIRKDILGNYSINYSH